MYEKIYEGYKQRRRSNPHGALNLKPSIPDAAFQRYLKRMMCDEFGRELVLNYDRNPWVFSPALDLEEFDVVRACSTRVFIQDCTNVSVQIRVFLAKGDKGEYELELQNDYENALDIVKLEPQHLTETLRKIYLNETGVNVTVNMRDRCDAQHLSADESGEMSDQDQSNQGYNIDTTGDHGARIQSIHAIPSNARSCMTKIVIPFMCADVEQNDANDDMLLIHSSASDDDPTDDEFIDKDTARDLQSRFRTVGGLRGTIADEEIVD